MYDTHSNHDPEYAALEKYIESKLLPAVKLQATKELYLLENVASKESLTTFVSSKFSDQQKNILKNINSALGLEQRLPTRFDDPVSYSIASGLMESVRSAAGQFGLPTSGYGGFCCAPTGRVNAQAVPIRIDSAPSKVFIVFESGLFTFVHGVISNIVASTPYNLLQGATLSDWKLVWNKFRTDEQHVASLTADAQAINACKSFFQQYDRLNLSYIDNANMGPAMAGFVAGMTRGCEIFIAAHEYVHAIAGHKDPTLDAAAVEKEADQVGSEIAAKVFEQEHVQPIYAIAGITLFLLASETDERIDNAHLPPQKRLALIVDAMFQKDVELKPAAKDIVELFTLVFEDLIRMASTS